MKFPGARPAQWYRDPAQSVLFPREVARRQAVRALRRDGGGEGAADGGRRVVRKPGDKWRVS
jgi:hypothetical protein